MKTTLDIDDVLYRAIKVEAARSGRAVRDIVGEALERWLEAIEDAEDAAASDAAMVEYDRSGGIGAADVFRHVAANSATSD